MDLHFGKCMINRYAECLTVYDADTGRHYVRVKLLADSVYTEQAMFDIVARAINARETTVSIHGYMPNDLDPERGIFYFDVSNRIVAERLSGDICVGLEGAETRIRGSLVEGADYLRKIVGRIGK